MSCKYCNLKKGPFKSEKIYTAFMKEINTLIKEGFLIKLDEVDFDGPFFITQYKCNACDQNWILKTPDQAFRGGWYEVK